MTEIVFQITPSHPLFTLNEEGLVSQKPFDFKPENWEFKARILANDKLFFTCQIVFYYSSDKKMQLLMKDPNNKNQKHIEKNDLIMPLEQGLNEVSTQNMSISSSKQEACLNLNNRQTKGKSSIGKMIDYVKSGRFKTKGNPNLSSNFFLRFYKYPFSNLSPKQVREIIESSLPKLITQIRSLLENQPGLSVDWADRNASLDRKKEEIVRRVSNLSSKVTNFCSEHGLDQGKAGMSLIRS